MRGGATIGSGRLRVRTFGDQDQARVALSDHVAGVVAEALELLEDHTNPGADVPEDMAAEFRRFLDAYGGELFALILARVVGPVLAAVELDSRGDAWITAERLGKAAPAVEGADYLTSRLAWLCREVPSLADHWGQLYDGERAEVARLVRAAYALDLARPEDRAVGASLLEALERFHLFAQPGGRLIRGDADAQATFLRWMNQAGELVARHRDQLAREARIASGSAEPAAPEERDRVLARLRQDASALEAKIEAGDKARVELARVQDRLAALGG